MTGDDAAILVSNVGGVLTCTTGNSVTVTDPNSQLCIGALNGAGSGVFSLTNNICSDSAQLGDAAAPLITTSCVSGAASGTHSCFPIADGTVVTFSSDALSDFGTLSFTFRQSNGAGNAVGTISTTSGGPAPSADTTAPSADTTAPSVAVTAPAVSGGPVTATFTFSEDVTGFALADITVGNGTASNLQGDAAVYTATITPSSNADVTLDVAAGVAQDGAGNQNTAATQVTIAGVSSVQTRTGGTINNFMGTRGNGIVSNDPDIGSRRNRGGGVGGGNSGGAGFVGLTANGTLASNQLGFSTSLRQVVAAREAQRASAREDLGAMMGLGQADATSKLSGGIVDEGLDIWVKGQWVQSETDTRESNLGLFYVGVDYRFGPSVVAGILAQFDRSDEDDATARMSAEGTGWMVGPYVALSLSENVTFDGRVAWGQADNKVSPFLTYIDRFDSTRWLVKGQLTGAYDLGGAIFSPHVGVRYFEETQDAYTDSLGIQIAGRDVALGQVTFGPKVSTSQTLVDGTVISPFIGVEGVWDFEAASTVDLTTGLATGSQEDLRARAEGGITISSGAGYSITGEGFYDGIGVDEFEAYGGSVTVRVPLQ